MSVKSIVSKLYHSHFLTKDTRQFRTWSIITVCRNFSEKVQSEDSKSAQRLKMVAICPPREQLPSMVKTRIANIGKIEPVAKKPLIILNSDIAIPTQFQLNSDQSQTNNTIQISTKINILIFFVKMGIFGCAVWWTFIEGIWGEARQAEVFWNRWISNFYMKLSTEKFIRMPPGCSLLQPNPPSEIMKEDFTCCFNQLIKKVTQ